ncbi:hypothetical protein FisN_6Hh397 [Fistulifera solaris]|uniref:EF-hand domain-containing protein n=1 Tax=Fistulifera solaris TaxID=1519565 RepID=A0A1Z5KEU3_FISSO|nr:hypothetical protein FisN_6Hh397 [Fistulifera solaris]|eukprot:GAX24834.1 hypothetical protein FisN_6Hh397 [Fistulifera solaris]
MGWLRNKNEEERMTSRRTHNASTAYPNHQMDHATRSASDGGYTQEADDDDALMITDHPPQEDEPQYDAEEASTRGEEETAEQDAQSAYMEQSRQNHLNSLFNGHLMKWKFEAEEGSSFIRIPAFIGALGLLGTAFAGFATEDDAWNAHAIVMGMCVIVMSIFILILDGRFMATNPLSTRAHLRNIITRNFNMFRFVWGRGLLYIIAGVLNIAQMWTITMISGFFITAVGLLAILVGVHASRKFAALRNSLADESFLLLVFSNYDADGDGYMAPHEFALLLADLGMELDDRYTLKAFNVIDTDSDRRISFDEFNHWWSSGYIERGRKRFHGDEMEDEYQRMDE